MTASEHIRTILSEDIDIPAGEVINQLQRNGVKAKLGLVYVVRSDMRKKLDMKKQLQQARQNDRALRDFVVEIFEDDEATWLTKDEIMKKCRSRGYKSTESGYNQWTRKVLKQMVEENTLFRNEEDEYRLNYIPEETPVETQETPVRTTCDVETQTQVTNLTSFDPAILVETGKICKRIGGVDKLVPYLDVLKELEK